MKAQRVVYLTPGVSWVADYLPSVLPPFWALVQDGMDGAAYDAPALGLRVILSGTVEQDGKRWLHLSVSHRARLPRWDELVEAKELFLGRETLAVQVIPPRSRHINIHPHVLHLWRCLDGDPVPDFAQGGRSI